MANLSQQRRQRMLDFLQKVREKNKDDDDALVAIGEIENEITEKKYGLVWEEHSEEVEERMVEEVPVFTEVHDKEIALTDDGYNFLLEGDNLHSLHLLEKTHKEKIDVIYIDPPYNTGSDDFMYDDNYIDKDDSFRHSKWLSFMNRRLSIAKTLLKPSGVIFISIDDNEQSQLKILCDSIFGEDNFVSCIINQSANSVFGTKAAHKDKTFIKTKDQILVYRKSEEYRVEPLYTPSKIFIYDSHEFVLDDGVRYSTSDWFEKKHKAIFDKYGLNVNKKNIQSLMEFDANFRKKVMDELVDKQFGTWPYTKDDLDDDEKSKIANGDIIEHNGLFIMRENNGKGLTRYLRSLKESCQQIDGEWRKCDILGDVWNNAAGYGNINAEGGVRFPSGKKPLLLLNKILKSSTDSSSIVLDFFAGSGTTGHAVLELNAEDGGNRKFILCTNNENNICEGVTYPRLQTVITGVRQDGNRYSDGIPANLKYYKTDYIPKKSDNLSADLIKHIDEMIQLEYHVKIDKDKYISVLTDEDADELEKNWQNFPDIRAIYISRSVLLTGKQRELFETKDCFVIPDYYFREELRDAGEA